MYLEVFAHLQVIDLGLNYSEQISLALHDNCDVLIVYSTRLKSEHLYLQDGIFSPKICQIARKLLELGLVPSHHGIFAMDSCAVEKVYGDYVFAFPVQNVGLDHVIRSQSFIYSEDDLGQGGPDL